MAKAKSTKAVETAEAAETQVVSGRTHMLSIYIPKAKQALGIVEKLEEKAAEDYRSVNYIVVDAICKYLGL